ncbi:MAG: hypothetical protein AAGJ35_10290, partial [Myxococcota bacterium]
VVLALLQASANGSNSQECVASFDANIDYFPNKVQPLESEQWSIAYENSYKLVTNIWANKTYLLYQCGTEPPQDQSQYDGVFSVPVEEVGLSSTPMIPFVELLSRRTSVKAWVGFFSFIHSPCINGMIDDGTIATIQSGDGANVTLLAEKGLNDTVFFAGGDSSFSNEVQVHAYEENFNLANFEWVKFYSAFFNLEKEANEIFDGTKNRYDCTVQNANILSADTEPKPTVLWGSYCESCGGWSVAKSCPEYYCEFAESCGATLLTSDGGSVEAFGFKYMTTEEFVEHGKDADYFIYTAADVLDTVFGQFKDEFANMTSVLKNEVYDTEGAGKNSWFEQRTAEPDAILQDFCTIVGTENPAVLHKLTFLRHVDDIIPTNQTCTDINAPLATLGTECVPLDAPTDAPASTPTADTDTETETGTGDSAASSGAMFLLGFVSLLAATLL